MLSVCRGRTAAGVSVVFVEEVQEVDNPLFCFWNNILRDILLQARTVSPVCGFLACGQRGVASVVSADAVLVFCGLLDSGSFDGMAVAAECFMASVDRPVAVGCFCRCVAVAGNRFAHGAVACSVFLVLFLFGLLAEV